MGAFDALPVEVREAISECPYDIHVTIRLTQGGDFSGLVERIRSLKSEKEAVEFTNAHMARRRWWT